MNARGLVFTDAGALRAPWRLLLFALAGVAAFVLLQTTVGPFLPASEDSTWWTLVATLLIAHAVTLKWVDRRPWSAVAMDAHAARPARLALGVAIGALAIGMPSLVLLGTRLLRVEPLADGSWWGAAAALALTLAPAAFAEELFFRGYPFAVIRESVGTAAALIFSSVVFGIVHYNNPGADMQSTLLVTVAGIFLGAVLLATRSLYAAWAAHFAWNWTMAALFHIQVSGLSFPTPDYRVVDAGPDWLTGGMWGPEGGAGAFAGMVGGMLLLRRIARRFSREESRA